MNKLLSYYCYSLFFLFLMPACKKGWEFPDSTTKPISPEKDLSNKLRPFLTRYRSISSWNYNEDAIFYDPGTGAQARRGLLIFNIEEPVNTDSRYTMSKKANAWKDSLLQEVPTLPRIGWLQCNWYDNENISVPLSNQ